MSVFVIKVTTVQVATESDNIHLPTQYLHTPVKSWLTISDGRMHMPLKAASTKFISSLLLLLWNQIAEIL